MSDDFAASATHLAGLSTLLFGWSPDQFWRTTPGELAAVFSAARVDGDASVPLAQSDLSHLMEQYPDG